ncbi:hypothetical protein BJ912DRAFT_935023 [Pholiota molesta]|nr:hypothetical protein BJ912DRAFT_935023 [Pholiota molesta]
MPIIAHFPPTQNQTQDLNSRPNTTPSLTLCPVMLTAIFCPNSVNHHRIVPPGPDATEINSWHPFEDRLAFDWAHYHFIELQSSARKINKGLDLWLAAKLKAGNNSPLPWSSPDDMYDTIDSIQEGAAPFTTIEFKYSGPVDDNSPKWMTQTYELCTRDSRKLLQNQLATTDFANQFDYKPYRQFDHQGDCVWSNLMSAEWAWNEADTVAQDPRTHGSMLVPVISGSDKTTVSVATGHQEYHPVYQSPGNLTNTARRGHGNSVLPVAFLPIPKTNKREAKRPEFQRFTRQLYHACLARIFAPLREGMTVPDIVWLAGIVQGWCPKCEARPDNLDGDYKKTRRRTVWDNYAPKVPTVAGLLAG